MNKLLMVLILSFGLTACGTTGGMIEGAGRDLQKAGEWIKQRGDQ